MDINIHPILVHFPITLLSLYSILEIARFPFLYKNKNIHVEEYKMFLLFLGEIAAIVAALAGKLALHSPNLPSSTRYLAGIDIHETLAELTILIFGISSLFYLAALLQPRLQKNRFVDSLAIISKIPYVLIPLALIGMSTLAVVGTLGGSIVYGPDFDPFTHFITGILVH